MLWSRRTSEDCALSSEAKRKRRMNKGKKIRAERRLFILRIYTVLPPILRRHELGKFAMATAEHRYLAYTELLQPAVFCQSTRSSLPETASLLPCETGATFRSSSIGYPLLHERKLDITDGAEELHLEL